MITKAAHGVARRLLPADSRAWYSWLETRRRWEAKHIKPQTQQVKATYKHPHPYLVGTPTFVPKRPFACYECNKTVPLSRLHGPRVSGW